MLKYVDTLVSFSEVPDEISLCINISNCPHNCPGCHSSYLTQDIGEELTLDKLSELIFNNRGISCVCFMGGDADPTYINRLAFSVKLISDKKLKVAWYSGNSNISEDIDLQFFDYIKIGPYIEALGPLNSQHSNQKMYKKSEDGFLIDISYKFHDNKTGIQR
jgi:anaerobic ribonucleoside-triphosphate reductase activating protein